MRSSSTETKPPSWFRIDAVERRGGDHRLWLIDPQSGEVAERVVEIGLTDLDSVEIVAGLKPGDHVAMPSK